MPLKARLQWRKFVAKMSAKVTGYVLALATLSSTTQIGSFLFVLVRPWRPRQGESRVTVTGVITLNFANGNTALILVKKFIAN
jgi:hypothetical protein